FIEGLVHVTELGSDYFQYDEIKNELRGERTGIRYRLSDRVRVQVSRVDLDARKIDFRLVRDTPVKAPRPSPAPAAAGAERGGNGNGPRVRALPQAEESAPRRKKAASAPSVAVKDARAARSAAKKKGGGGGGAPAKPTAKKAHARKKY
ncbi:MAG: S1 RNA-binding domain-containing protein, partial [Burkholderia sp.]